MVQQNGKDQNLISTVKKVIRKKVRLGGMDRKGVGLFSGKDSEMFKVYITI